VFLRRGLQEPLAEEWLLRVEPVRPRVAAPVQQAGQQALPVFPVEVLLQQALLEAELASRAGQRES